MATLALYALGAAAFPGLLGVGGSSVLFGGITAAAFGGIIGGTLGGFVDQTFLFPAIFGNQQAGNGPRLDNLQVQLASEGSPIFFCIGPENRIAGTVIWKTDLIETKHTKSSGGLSGGGQKQKSYTYSCSVAIGVCEGAIEAIDKIWANGKVIYDGITNDSRYDSLTIYKGTGTQMPDPIIESYEGAGQVPGHRGRAYVVIENLQLEDFGRQLPSFTFLVRQQTDTKIKAAIKTILTRAGWSPDYYDLTALSDDDNLRGYAVAGPQSISRLLEPIVLAYSLNVRETSGVLEFFPRKNGDAVTIPVEDLAAHEFGGEVPRSVSITDNGAQSLPNEIFVQFVDPTNNYQQGSQQDTKIQAANRISTTLTLPMVLSAGQAKAIAARQLWSSWAERLAAEFYVTPRYVNLQEGDIVAVSIGNEQYKINITDVATGWNLISQVKGVVMQSQTITDVTGSSDTGSGSDGGTIVTPLSSLTTHLLNLPPMQDDQVKTPGYYVATCATNSAKKFRGATLYRSTDGVNFEELDSFDEEAVIGVTTSVLGVGPVGIRDIGNTVDVTLKEGDLTSATLDQISNGKNIAVVGSEIIAFETATLIGVRQYRLSNLYRGLRDTVDSGEIGGHVINEKFVLLDPNSIHFISIPVSAINTPIYLKMVPAFGLVANYPSVNFTPNGETIRCFRPSPIVRDTTTGTPPDIVIKWFRQSRYVSSVLGGVSNPLDEPTELYDLKIYEWTGSVPGALLRTVSAIAGVTSYNYTAAMQTTDGRSVNGASVYVEVFQLSAVLGRGNTGSAVV